MKKSIVFIIAGFILMAGTLYAATAISASGDSKAAITEMPDKDPKAQSSDDKKGKECCSDKKADANKDKSFCKSASDSKGCSDSKSDGKKSGCGTKTQGASTGNPETKSASAGASAQAAPAGSGSNCSRTKCQ